ncbi:MAG: translation initiation factor SUI1 [Candidatus Parvarchaeum acidophilus ARMAN-5]|jgi:translation initiation factor 1|uniref:Protein translation factor SUI1 homolog n=1 Tax=Candidatus Parvarchaeum acidophilus ARMAN-5 TaxID=662762 RepID=D6GWU5_PARA5|nr:MAG: translation initiation factor SUI1 [Candidatus Parvarchaeum acidophilus ARMAN-5]
MTEVCPVCGLPKDLCICGTISQETQKIKIYTKKVSYRKVVTVISGMDPKTTNIKELTKKLKTKIACGGTYKDSVIELQGEHTEKAKELLLKEGFPEASFS